MFYRFTLALLLCLSPWLAKAQDHQFHFELYGYSFLQWGSIGNIGATPITRLEYDLGDASPGNAVFQTYMETSQQSHWVATDRFMRSSWDMALRQGDTFEFAGLDIDAVANASPFEFEDQVVDENGRSFNQATIRVFWADDYNLTFSLAHGQGCDGWRCDRVIELVTLPVSEPFHWEMLLIGLGLLAFKKLYSNNLQ